jgi:hypothetical protein
VAILTDKIVLREADEAECRLGGMSGIEALEQSVLWSDHSYMITSPDGDILAFFGWRNDSAVCASCKAWMLSTPAIEKWSVFAGRKSLETLEALLQDHHSVTCIVDPAYRLSVRWLRWLGFRKIGSFDRFDEYRITRGGLA